MTSWTRIVIFQVFDIHVALLSNIYFNNNNNNKIKVWKMRPFIIRYLKTQNKRFKAKPLNVTLWLTYAVAVTSLNVYVLRLIVRRMLFSSSPINQKCIFRERERGESPTFLGLHQFESVVLFGWSIFYIKWCICGVLFRFAKVFQICLFMNNN